jgi:signal transduction histidine kinase
MAFQAGAWHVMAMANQAEGVATLQEPGPIGLSTISSLVSLVVCAISYSSIYASMGPYAPAKVMYWWAAAHWVFMIIWLSLDVLRFIMNRLGRRHDGFWAQTTKLIVIVIYIGMNVDVWLLIPYTPVEYQLVGVISVTATVAILVLTLPEWGMFNRIVNTATLLSVAAMLVVRNVGFWESVAPTMLGYAAAIYILARKLEHSVTSIREAKLQAEAQRDARTRFMASASHDLAQPLHSARLMLDLAAREPERTKREDLAKQARSALYSVDRQLKMMLDHLRLDADKVPVNIRECAVGPLALRVASQFEPIAAMNKVMLKTPPSRLVVMADPELLERALGNLIDNALRHADARRVLIGTRGKRLWVIDDGKGIPAKSADALFNDFEQGEKGDSKPRGGFGLGLGSALRLMRLMKGDAGIEVKWRRGSAFFLSFP